MDGRVFNRNFHDLEVTPPQGVTVRTDLSMGMGPGKESLVGYIRMNAGIRSEGVDFDTLEMMPASEAGVHARRDLPPNEQDAINADLHGRYVLVSRNETQDVRDPSTLSLLRYLQTGKITELMREGVWTSAEMCAIKRAGYNLFYTSNYPNDTIYVDAPNADKLKEHLVQGKYLAFDFTCGEVNVYEAKFPLNAEFMPNC